MNVLFSSICLRYFGLNQSGGSTDQHATSMAKTKDTTCHKYWLISTIISAGSIYSGMVSREKQPGWEPKSVRDSGLCPGCILLTDPPDAHFLEARLQPPRPLAAGPVRLRCEIEGVYKMTPPASSVWEEGKHARNIFHIFLQRRGKRELLVTRLCAWENSGFQVF